jgi:hypothetical protein
LNQELNNGRLAMIGVAGIVAQELRSGKGIIETIDLWYHGKPLFF